MCRRICSLILSICIMGYLAAPIMAAETQLEIQGVLEQGIEEEQMEQEIEVLDKIEEDQPIVVPSQPEPEIIIPPVANKEGIYLQIGSPNATVKGEKYILDISPQVVKGATLVPLRFISEALNVQVEWIQKTQKVIITKGTQKVELKINDSSAIVNGKRISIGTAPIVENGRTLVPLRFVSDQFNLEVIYDNASRKITLLPLVPPIAQFKFGSDRYMAGQAVTVVNESYSPNGEPIVESLWEINNNKSLQTKDLSTMFKRPTAGTYSVKLKVRNAKNAWSEWIEQIIVIEPHPQPLIISFFATKQEWAQGEEILFRYTTHVEPWEKIVESRWTYQKDGQANKTIGKPRALFHEGTYTISLEVKDSYGSWSLASTTQIHISEEVKSSELAFKFSNLQYGETVDNFGKFNFQSYEPIEDFSVVEGGPKLLFSNSPETVLQKGVLYADEAVGETRVLYHHRNGMKNSSTNTRFVIVVENKGAEPATIIETKKSTVGPSDDILHLGQLVTSGYFDSKLNNKIVLKPNEKKYLYDTGTRKWGDYESFSGVLEFTSDKPVTVTIAAVDKGFNLEGLAGIPILPRDGIHTRGTFPNANRSYNISIPSDRPSKILFGQREDDMDRWIDGYDALTGTREQNKGNYGVVYELILTSQDKTGILLNPRGTSFKGAFKWEDDKGYLAPNKGIFIGSQESAIVGVVNGGVTRKILYTLSNGSSGPVLFNFIPERFWSDY